MFWIRHDVNYIDCDFGKIFKHRYENLLHVLAAMLIRKFNFIDWHYSTRNRVCTLSMNFHSVKYNSCVVLGYSNVNYMKILNFVFRRRDDINSINRHGYLTSPSSLLNSSTRSSKDSWLLISHFFTLEVISRYRFLIASMPINV